jgi:hypothetical protein
MTTCMRTIQWKCTANPTWQWMSGSEGNPGFPTANDGVRHGTITLPPNPNYWYECEQLVIPGTTTGNAYVRYFQENGVDQIQAITVAQGQWIDKGPVTDDVSVTNSQGGINLAATLA